MVILNKILFFTRWKIAELTILKCSLRKLFLIFGVFLENDLCTENGSSHVAPATLQNSFNGNFPEILQEFGKNSFYQ